MLNVMSCHGCVHLSVVSPEPVETSVQNPCLGCFMTSAGTPSNYEPQKYTVTTQIGVDNGE